MVRPINWIHLIERHRGMWVALAEDETTVLAAGKTAKEAHDTAAKLPGHHFLYRVPETTDLFVGYAIQL